MSPELREREEGEERQKEKRGDEQGMMGRRREGRERRGWQERTSEWELKRSKGNDKSLMFQCTHITLIVQIIVAVSL